jgi:hypothetical protein
MLRHVVCYNLDMDFKKVKITTYVPLDSADNVRSVLGMAVGEERIEVVCDRTNAKMVIESLKLAHPYEEVAFDVTPLLDIDNL